MSIGKHAGAWAFGLTFATVLGLGLGSARLEAQEPATRPAAPAATKAPDPSRRVPPYFGQIGLTPEQKEEEIYKIRARHNKRIEEIQKQLAQAQTAMLSECETVLNDTQKTLLATRREAAAKARAAKAVKAAQPADSEKATEKAKSGN